MAIRSVSLRLIFSEKMAIICPPELPRRENGIVRYLAPNRSSRLVPCHRAHENLFSIRADGQIHSGMTDDHFKYSRNGSYSSIYFYFYHLTQYPRCSTSQHSSKPCFQRTLTLGEVAELARVKAPAQGSLSVTRGPTAAGPAACGLGMCRHVVPSCGICVSTRSSKTWPFRGRGRPWLAGGEACARQEGSPWGFCSHTGRATHLT